ncbi:hypothetical protein LX32DRAFT_643726 [Colletotrichum zoysiae]|uniref:Uncharacterized protein n=1 Tax=Colletotrichum zoysiae TaxID=1216348 RepID=A0AAD9LW23_9PEZI|nr:hypothetical protein LX32DRAFT_643726 [Colletotrichum zoysiae]
MDRTNEKALRLFYLSSLFCAVNDSCREMNNITYSSGDHRGDRVLSPFQKFLCKLAQVCDAEKGGDTITALVALRAADGPGYHLASNGRKPSELESTKNFLSGLLDYVGRNPDGLAEKPLKKQVLWRVLEFNLPRVRFYLKQVIASVGECIASTRSSGTQGEINIVARLRIIEDSATFPLPDDMQSDQGARLKFLKDCETLIKTIQDAMATGFSLVVNQGADADDPETSHAWCQLRHHLGRLHSYRQAAEVIVETSRERPELFAGFTVAFVPYSRPKRLSLPRTTLSLEGVIEEAFPDRDLQAYAGHIEQLREYGLEGRVRERLEQRAVQQSVHCEVLLQDFLARMGVVRPQDYYDNSMFIATSKPPCRLCHYFFKDPENDFLVQTPHMNVYPKWRLPDVYEEEGQDRDAVVARREELLDDLIWQMQQDTLGVVRGQHSQWKRNDSRTESWANVSRYGGGSDTRASGRFSSASGTSGQGGGIGAEAPRFGFRMPAAVETGGVSIGLAT